MKIVLVGYMGCGKSTIARELAQHLSVQMIDLDDYIVEHEALSITEIFKRKGEIYFRKLENKLLKKLLTHTNDMVLAVGGGTPCYADNMSLLKKYTVSYYLKASLQTLHNRLVLEKQHRPLIKDLEDHQLLEFIAKHLFERRPYYEQANYTIQTDDLSTDAIVEEIRLSMR